MAPIAPIACYKGDTTTGFAVHGSPEFHAAALMNVAGLEKEKASKTVEGLLLGAGRSGRLRAWQGAGQLVYGWVHG